MKNTIRTLLSGLTTLAVAISAMSFTALATENKDTSNMTELIISSQEAYAGDVVTVTVGIKNNPGITAVGAVLTFDEDLEFVEYEDTGLMLMLGVEKSGNYVIVAGASASGNSKDYAVVNLYFKTPEDAEEGTVYEINWYYIDLLATDDGLIDNIAINGSITIIEEKYMIGDVNYDKKINGVDAAVALRMYNSIMRGKKSEIINEQLIRADVNKDGRVNSQDATLILRYYVKSLLNPNITWEDVINS